jgi:hypothetical protein
MFRFIFLFSLFSTSAWAESVMKCDGFFAENIYRHQNTFFSSEVEVRRDGKWTEWCMKDEDDIFLELDIFEDGAVCKRIATLGEPLKADEYGYRKGDQFLAKYKTTLDFRFQTRVWDIQPVKPDLTEYEDEEGPNVEGPGGKSVRNAKFDCEKM